MTKRFSGMTAIVTGASRGIGRAAVIAFATEGANVVINYRSHRLEAEKVLEQVESLGAAGLLCQADVADQQATQLMLEQSVTRFGKVDVAVSNAAYSDRERFYQADMKGFHRTIDVTMWGAFHLLHAVSRHMIQRGEGGSVVVVSSPHAFVPVPNSMAYNMAKAAIDHMARTAAIELAEHRIRVNVVQPGWTDTPGERKFASEQTLQQAGQMIPLGRLGTPAEMADGILYLCDPRNTYLTGSTLLIDGGITLPWWSQRGSVTAT